MYQRKLTRSATIIMLSGSVVFAGAIPAQAAPDAQKEVSEIKAAVETTAQKRQGSTASGTPKITDSAKGP